MELLIGSVKDIGLFRGEVLLAEVVKQWGEDAVSSAVSTFKEVRSKLSTGKSTTGKAGTNAEQNYSRAYQRLVRMGLAVQIKKKYR